MNKNLSEARERVFLLETQNNTLKSHLQNANSNLFTVTSQFFNLKSKTTNLELDFSSQKNHFDKTLNENENLRVRCLNVEKSTLDVAAILDGVRFELEQMKKIAQTRVILDMNYLSAHLDTFEWISGMTLQFFEKMFCFFLPCFENYSFRDNIPRLKKFVGKQRTLEKSKMYFFAAIVILRQSIQQKWIEITLGFDESTISRAVSCIIIHCCLEARKILARDGFSVQTITNSRSSGEITLNNSDKKHVFSFRCNLR